MTFDFTGYLFFSFWENFGQKKLNNMEFTTIYLATFQPIFPMKNIFIPFLILPLTLIALLHFYWAFGGKWGLEKSVPSKEDGTLLFSPTPFQCAFVGFSLILMIGFILSGMIYALNSYLPQLENPAALLPNWMYYYGFWLLGGIFTLRAIGDFNYVGFFKKVKNTSFGKLDSKFYSPLCLVIASIFFWMASTI
ncbi:MAG: hypothetical protein ACJAT4_003147 [Granulosicoccus sp.]|jgi:hypothetical protein